MRTALVSKIAPWNRLCRIEGPRSMIWICDTYDFHTVLYISICNVYALVLVYMVHKFACGYAWLTVYAHLHLVYTHVPSLHMCYI